MSDWREPRHTRSREHTLRGVEHFGLKRNPATGKASPVKPGRHWCFDGPGKQPRSPAPVIHRDSVTGTVVGAHERPDRSHLSRFSPKVVQPDSGAAKQQGYKGAAWQCDIVKRWKVPFTVTLPDGTTEERSKWMWKRRLALLIYGKVMEYTFTNVRGSRVTRLHDDAKWDKSFALSEFVRMMDQKQGIAALASLMGESETNEGAVAA